MTGLHPEDQELVARFVDRGDEEAFRVLFRRYTPRLYALALRLMARRSSEAEDVVQEAWHRASRRLPGFEWRSSLPTWLTSIVVNCAYERLRRRTADAVDAEVLGQVPGPKESPDLAMDLDRAIASLPDGYREVLVLHDVEGRTHDEIAAMLGVAAGTSKSQLFHARRALRAWLTRDPKGTL